MKTKELTVYDDKAYGTRVSKYGLENGYLDYKALAEIVGDCILNNTLRSETAEEWDIVTGEFDSAIYQDYIITEAGYSFLREYTDEIVFYNERLDIYVWGITHFETSWDYVLTDIKLVKGE